MTTCGDVYESNTSSNNRNNQQPMSNDEEQASRLGEPNGEPSWVDNDYLDVQLRI